MFWQVINKKSQVERWEKVGKKEIYNIDIDNFLILPRAVHLDDVCQYEPELHHHQNLLFSQAKVAKSSQLYMLDYTQ